ncbi:crotonobetainyl-CoA:carnitine CoA-transferase CaiB-like acyl-CoA transferase [Labedella gwakjiensis]|uniref:CoA transferase n=1 Tax=Labedella gwakjiensis TaxID=390269 RepID=A0A2P8GWT0_9MICO|nr:CoA transferase [Labedella gwakjiensis]PSL38419.1 crotonobetainyl-CoA:carnitine CoA-transferase CaiB-like acyl-CoA transferase [Labedella gwakjiensis]RUQ87056.1 CoA transferase [Labedella gwakjiensis]
MPGALDGVTVLDFSRVLAGPYATMMLADLGATVVKIERAGVGDETRAWGPPFDATGTSTYFTSVNRNKSSLAVDLRDPAQLAELRERVATADVIVENFRAGAMERLGLGYDDVRAIRPDVVYCSITGFGSGAGAGLPGFDLLVQAVGGLMSITGTHPGDPTKTGVALVDVVTGLHATTGILAALFHRARTGEGQRIEVNLLSSLLSALVNQASGFVGAGVVPGIIGNAHPSIAPYETFATADRPLVVAVGTDGQFRAFAQAIGRPELADDERFRTNTQRVAHRAELNAIVGPVLAAASADDWFGRMTANDVPAGPINTISEAFAFAESLGLGPVVDVDGSPQVASPLTLSATPVRYRSRPPHLGEAVTGRPT